MSEFTPDIRVFCCHYTSQQTCADGPDDLRAIGMPDSVRLNRVPCTGKLQVNTLLKAFEDGADGVCVIGCPPDQCHNVTGSQRAAKRVGAVRKALQELGVEEERVAMFHLQRGFHPEFVAAARQMNEQVTALGPSPMKGEAE